MKKLYKNKAKGKISGVCQGIAEYFRLDPSVVRILWVLASFGPWGIGLPLYIACAFILPDKEDLGFENYTVSDEKDDE